NYASNNVSVVSDATDAVVATVPVGSSPISAAYVSENGEVFVANYESNNVSVISDATNTVLATVAVGSEPVGVAYDSGTGEVYISNYAQGTISVLAGVPPYAVTFTEIGIPTGTSWSVTLDGATNYSTGPTVGFSEPDGAYPFYIGAPIGYNATPADGMVAVAGAPVNQAVTFTPAYPVTFTETGLPTGTIWTVTLGGTTRSSATSAITFSEPDGSYTFRLWSVSGYSSAQGSGSVTVNGLAVSKRLGFSATGPGSPGLGQGLFDLPGYTGLLLLLEFLVAVGIVVTVTATRRGPPLPPSGLPPMMGPPPG
ncbi:MAG: hypothetical protein WCB19_02580, partial [Thermoplasmata archaeon]